ncbi:MAG TPA: GGDEF domain-containing phosphodiesterase [Candidatus Lachnoclostridium stercorigallinarum]|uniref:GGDEF domain-containing phosphodiesterase n=1 Tax=Candidatus Lachnoclostridium stercorigallinarum TaxID=2838634 RepID=A0A9D2K530_9FIRM|nr:GGDEF domain-containing phosphodiesterase [Candidatus Lachnoclostridium stercorigallinarum]
MGEKVDWDPPISLEPLKERKSLHEFQEAVERRLERSPGGAVAVFNMRQFKYINESFGREKGDQLLAGVISAMSQRKKKEELFCWVGGDVFYVFIDKWDRDYVRQRLESYLRGAARVSMRILKNSQAAFYCGAVISNPESATENYSLERMLTHVMYALEKAKEFPGNKIWFFDAELHKKELQENRVELQMQRALREEEFKLYLQPKVDPVTRQLKGAEALVRWYMPKPDPDPDSNADPDPEKDYILIPPGEFMPVFERTGFSSRLDQHMLQEVGNLLRSWRKKGIRPIPLSVNLSRKALFEESYIRTLEWVKANYQIKNGEITLEILESVAFGNLEIANEILEKVRNMGYRISMDDFGSGYSSLNVLAKLKIDELKIDQAFLRGMEKGSREERILETIMKLAKDLNIPTVVEGVETLDHETLVKSLGCGCVQGYLYSRPISACEFTEKFMKDSQNGYQFQI